MYIHIYGIVDIVAVYGVACACGIVSLVPVQVAFDLNMQDLPHFPKSPGHTPKARFREFYIPTQQAL